MIEQQDCHRSAELDKWIGIRAIITTTKGKVRGRLVYKDGWYYCNAGERWVRGKWVQTYHRFFFRKTQFKKIVATPNENSNGW